MATVQVNLFQKLATSAEHVVYQNCSECQNKTKTTICICSPGIMSLQFSLTMNSLSSYCGLVDAKIRASDKYLPVWIIVIKLTAEELWQQRWHGYNPLSSMNWLIVSGFAKVEILSDCAKAQASWNSLEEIAKNICTCNYYEKSNHTC